MIDITPCEGSGKPWDQVGGSMRPGPCCPACDATPATLRVPDDEPQVPDHPNMVVWSGRVDVVRWRTHRAANRPDSAEQVDACGYDREVICDGCGDEWNLRPGEDMKACPSCGSRKIGPAF